MPAINNGNKLDSLRAALNAAQPGTIAPLLQGLKAAQLADLLESLQPRQRLPVWRELDAATRGEVLVEAHRDVRAQLIAASTPQVLALAVQWLDLDELSDIDEALPPEVFDAVLRAMDDQRRARFDLVRSYADDTAGGLMDVDAISVRPDITLATVISFLAHTRAEHGRLPAELNAVNVVDADGIYLGRVPLTDLVSLGVEQKVQEVMDTTLAPIEAGESAAVVTRRFADEDLVSAPVVDAQGRLLGRITVDDVLDQVRRRGEHEAMGAVGLDEGTDTFAPAWLSARKRAIWLGINLMNALVAAAVIGFFDATIERLVALAVLMPVVSSMGGVAGTQSLALVIRGLALEQVNRANRWRLLRRELAVAAINGLLWAVVVGLLAWWWFGQPLLSLIFGAAIIVNLIAGVGVGTVIPMLLARFKVDAAIAGEVLLVAFTDTFGFFIFLGLAALFLTHR
jgi:magnesium transporter